MFAIKETTLLFIVLFISISMAGENISTIMKVHDGKVKKLKKSYDANVKKISKYTVKRLEQLKKATTRAGKLKEAIEIQNEINRLQGKAPIATAIDEGDIGGEVPLPPGEARVKFSEKSEKRYLKKRYIDFHEALIQNKYEKALEYLDPSITRSVDKKIIQGHLRIIAGVLQTFQIKKGGIGIERVKFTKKLKEAKIIGKLRSSQSRTWEENKDPSYWIYKRGKWYLGDKNTLKKLF